ncbi:MAG: TIGR00180 family glycosyltransferase, partial [Alphaproteobacteria bacterium]|nr:TIGR00180 family glycosyltransferase [Alphaproteobacteria bacterium]
CFQVRRQAAAVISPHDYGFLREYCPGGRYTAIGDSDELLMVELQARDSEAEMLEPAPRFASACEGLDYRIAKIVANAAEWSTAEHRRAFDQSLMFHSTNPPSDAAEQLAEFDRQMARIVERLPPPLPAVRHYQWLPAVHLYRAALSADGAADYPDLIKADANRIIVRLFEIDTLLATSLRPQWVPTSPPDRPDILAETLAGTSAVITLDGLVNEVWELAPAARIFPVAIEELHSPDREMTCVLPAEEYAPGCRLCIYLLIASLPHWHKLRDICDAALAAGGQVRMVFRDQDWARVDLRQQADAWMLSQLDLNFAAERYTASIALIPAEGAGERRSEPASSPPPTICHGFIVDIERLRNDPIKSERFSSAPTLPSPASGGGLRRGEAAVESGDLTAVIPAHNRVGPCIALVRFLRACGFEHRLVVADSSTPERAVALRAGLSRLAEYQSFDDRQRQYPKLAQIARAVETPYVVLLPDDDILFPHAIEAALSHLKQHPTHVAAHGYSLRFGLEHGDFDIYQVEHFIPTIDDADPMWRYAYLMQRYQPHIWAVFRTEVYAEAMAAAARMPGTLFQELMFQIVSILKGPVARLPLIYAMRGMEVSQVAYSEADPFQWLLNNAESFFQSYGRFRTALAHYIDQNQIGPSPHPPPGTPASAGGCPGAPLQSLGHPRARPRRPVASVTRGRGGEGSGGGGPLPVEPRLSMAESEASLEQLLDLVNASYLARCLELGKINHTVEHLLGRIREPVRFPGPWAGWSEPRPEDLVRRSASLDRRYVWRKAVLEAEPKDEIMITLDEIARVEAELDSYLLDG